MKKLIFVILFAVAFIMNANAQNLYTATYTSVIRDTVAINGSTDAGSDWFTNKGYDVIYAEIFNGTYWYTVEVDYPCKNLQKIKAYMEGSDTTLMIQGYLETAMSVSLPLKNGYYAPSLSTFNTSSYLPLWYLRLGGTTAFYVAFRGYYKRNL